MPPPTGIVTERYKADVEQVYDRLISEGFSQTIAIATANRIVRSRRQVAAARRRQADYRQLVNQGGE